MNAPLNLSEQGSALWVSIADAYELRPDELRVLGQACRELDLIAAMESELDGSPLMSTGSMGQPVVHPLVSELRQHRTVLASLLRALKLPEDESGAPAVNQQRQAGNASWAKRGA
jgi:hypothetical protein